MNTTQALSSVVVLEALWETSKKDMIDLVSPMINYVIAEASGISVGENPLIALTSELFLDSEPEAKTSHRVSGLPLTGSERNATMADRR